MNVSRKSVAVLGLVLVAAVAGTATWLVRRQTEPVSPLSEPAPAQAAAEATPAAVKRTDSPPELDLADVDVAVVRLISLEETSVRQNPGSAQAWGKLGMVHLAHDFADAASECFDQAILRAPREARWHYLRGLAVIRLQPDAALPHLTHAVELCRDEPLPPRLRLLELYLELDRLDEAESLLRKFLADHPENSRGHLAMARLALRRGRPEDCLQELQLASGERAALKPSHELRAEVYQRQGRREDAEAERRLAAQSPSVRWPDPFHEEALRLRTGLKLLLTRADRLFTQGRPAESILVLDETLKQYPNSDWAWILLGRAQIRLRHLDEAEQSLRKALSLTPDSADAQFRLGVVYSLRGREREAIPWFEKVLAQKADHPVALLNLGVCLQKVGETSKAVKSFRKAIDCQLDYYDAHIALGNLLWQDGQKAEARKAYERAAILRPNEQWVRDRLQELTQPE